jgi:hypothetical protein
MSEHEPVPDPASGDWHIDKRIPVALIVALLIQAAAAVWWAAGVQARVAVLEQKVITSAEDRERLVRIETTVAGIDQRLVRMEDRR